MNWSMRTRSSPRAAAGTRRTCCGTSPRSRRPGHGHPAGAVLGDQKLNYVGASYGRSSATYACSRNGWAWMALDGAMHRSCPHASSTGTRRRASRRRSSPSRRTACARATARWAAGHEPGPGRQEPQRLLQAARREADPDGRRGRPQARRGARDHGCDRGDVRPGGVAAAAPGAHRLTQDKDGAGLLALSDSYYERDADGKYANLMFANAAVNCLDLPAAFSMPEQVEKDLPVFSKASPVFGDGLAWASRNCAYWPVRPTGEPTRHRGEGRGPDPRGRHHPVPGHPPTPGPSPSPPSSPPASCSPTSATDTPRTAGASASTPRSTATSSRHPSPQRESAAHSPPARPGTCPPGGVYGAPPGTV